MTRRDWLLLLGIGLCSGVISACTHTNAGVSVRDVRSDERQSMSDALQRKPSNAILTSNAKTAGAAPPVEAVEKASPSVSASPQPDVVPPLLVALPEPPPKPKPTPIADPPAPTQPAVSAPALEPPLLTALRCFLDGRPSRAEELMSRFPKENQDLLLRLLPLIVRLTQVSVAQTSPSEMAIFAEQLDGLIAPLRARAELSIDKMCFIKECNGFGDYVPLPNEFAFGHEHKVRVYLEARNFSSTTKHEANGDDSYTIELKSRLEIRSARDGKLRTITVPVTRNRSRSPRRDFYVVYEFHLPEDMAPGWYKLSIEIIDVATQRAAKARTLDFCLASIPSAGAPAANRAASADR